MTIGIFRNFFKRQNKTMKKALTCDEYKILKIVLVGNLKDIEKYNLSETEKENLKKAIKKVLL